MSPEEHFTCSKCMFASMLYHGLRQLPYNLSINMQQFLDSITAVDPKINNGEPYKGRDWDYSSSGNEGNIIRCHLFNFSGH